MEIAMGDLKSGEGDEMSLDELIMAALIKEAVNGIYYS
jgi:hypothetical protein